MDKLTVPVLPQAGQASSEGWCRFPIERIFSNVSLHAEHA